MTNRKHVILIIGLPGSGKTTIAKRLSRKYNIQHLSTELLRAEYLNIDREESDCDFTEEQQKHIYSELANKAVKILKTNDCLIIDGVFRSQIQRTQLYETLSEIEDINYLKFWIQCEESIEVARLIERKNSNTICPAGVETFKKIKIVFEPPTVNENFIPIDNSDSLDSSLHNIFYIVDAVLL